MKKLLMTVALCATLSACGGGGNRPRPDLGEARSVQVPRLPDNLNRRAERLPPIADGSLGTMTRDGVATDRAYNDLAHRHNAVLDAYECVRLAVNARDAEYLARCLREGPENIPAPVEAPRGNGQVDPEPVNP